MSTAFEGVLGAGEAIEREMAWGDKQTLVEKNVSHSLAILMSVVPVLPWSLARQNHSLPSRTLLLVP